MIAAVNEGCRRYIFILTISLDKMNYTRKTLIVIVAVLLALPLAARERKNFDKGWQFALDEKMTAEQAFKAEGWRVLDLPHDWAIEGDFHAGNPSGACLAEWGGTRNRSVSTICHKNICLSLMAFI